MYPLLDCDVYNLVESGLEIYANMKIAVLDVHDEKYEHIFEISAPIKEAYCRKHGYDFIYYPAETPLVPLDRQENWARVQGIIYHLKSYDWILYLDTDILITNDEIKIESFIDNSFNLIVGPLADEGHIMTSSMLIKNCRWSFEFFLDLYSQTQFICQEYYSCPENGHRATGNPCTGGLFFEQSSFHFLYDNFEKYRNKIKRTPQNMFNSETKSYKQGDFLIHFPSQLYKRKIMMKMLDEGYESALSLASPVNLRDERIVLQEKYFTQKKIKNKFIKGNFKR